MNKFGCSKNKRRIHYKYFGSGINEIGLGMNKNLLIFQFSEIWGQKEDTYHWRGITRVPSGGQPHRRSAIEGRRDGPCRTETLAMRRVRFVLFHNISVKIIFFNSWRILWKFLQGLTSGIHQHFHWFLGVFSTHCRYIWLQRDTWFLRQYL